MPFQSGRTGVVSSFPYSDIAQGKSQKVYYGGVVSGANLISPGIFYSDDISTSGAITTATTWIKTVDLDFDITFNRTIAIEGLSVVSLLLIRATPSGRQMNAMAKVKISKLDAAQTLTEIVSEDSSKTGYNHVAGIMTGMAVGVKLDVPKTKFKKGETIRLTVEIWGYAEDTLGNMTIGMAHDPKNRSATTAGTEPTQLMFEIPFVVDI